jgi:glycosyltransferase involved in cell wall biosynthesis
MDIFAFTSVEKDTSPLALLSALSSGLPIVAFDIEGVRELIDEDEQLLTVPIAQSAALSQALLKLIHDSQLRSRLGRSGRRLAERKFSLEQYVARIEEVFSRIDQRSSRELNPNVPSMAPQPLP